MNNHPDYIKREDVKELIRAYCKDLIERDKDSVEVLEFNAAIQKEISKILAADVVEVKHGEWKHRKKDRTSFDCSICGHTVGAYIAGCANYCPNCGAKMDGEVKKEG